MAKPYGLSACAGKGPFDRQRTFRIRLTPPIIVVTHDEKIIPTFRRLYNIRDGVTVEEQLRTTEP